jgi:hypothetical protein
MIEKTAPPAADLRGDLGHPDDRLDRLYLAEEGTEIAELVGAPVLEQPGCLGRDQPIGRVPEGSPEVKLLAQLVEDRRRVVLLPCVGEAPSLIEDQLAIGELALLRLGDRCDELRPPPLLDNPVGWLSTLVEFPVAPRKLIGRIEDRPVEKRRP